MRGRLGSRCASTGDGEVGEEKWEVSIGYTRVSEAVCVLDWRWEVDK